MLSPNSSIKTYGPEKAKEFYEKGNKFMKENQLDSALMCFTTAANSAIQGETTADSLLAVRAYNKCGVINFFNKNYHGAYSNYKKAIKAGGKEHSYWVDGNIAIILSRFGAYDDSERLFLQTYLKSKEAADWKHVIPAYSNILDHCFLHDRLSNIKDIMAEFQNLDMPRDDVTLYFGEVTKGMLSYNNKNYNEALQFFKKASELSVKTNEKNHAKLDCATYIAKTFKEMGRPDSALNYLNKAVALGHNEELGDNLVNLYLMMSECYKDLNQTQKAKEYLLKHFALKDSISSMNDFSLIKNLDLNYEVENYENNLIKINKDKEQSQRYLIIISVAMLVFLILFIIVINQNRSLKASNKSLFEKNLEVLKASETNKSNYFGLKSDPIATSSLQTESETDSSADCDNIAEDEDIDESMSDPGRMKISVEEQNRIKNAIENFFYSSDEWKQSDFGLTRLCEIVESNKLYVSQVINNVMATNFHTLLNSHRINEARRRLLDIDAYGGMTIEAIAESLGYKSRSNFSKNFKKFTGLNPKEYVILAKSNPSIIEKELG